MGVSGVDEWLRLSLVFQSPALCAWVFFQLAASDHSYLQPCYVRCSASLAGNPGNKKVF